MDSIQINEYEYESDSFSADKSGDIHILEFESHEVRFGKFESHEIRFREFDFEYAKSSNHFAHRGRNTYI